MSVLGVGRTKLAAFADFTGYSPSALKVARFHGHLPFEHDVRLHGHLTYGPSEFLAWALTDHLVNRHCIVRRAAAAAVRCSGIAERFMDDLGFGQDVSDLHLAIWHEAGDPEGQRWVGVMRGHEVAALRQSDTAPRMICHRLNSDGAASENRAPRNVSSVVSAAVAPQWRAAIDRARRVGIELRPGLVRLLAPPPRRQPRKIGTAAASAGA